MLTMSGSPVRDDRVLFVERSNELVVSGKVKAVKAGAVAKASANSAFWQLHSGRTYQVFQQFIST